MFCSQSLGERGPGESLRDRLVWFLSASKKPYATTIMKPLFISLLLGMLCLGHPLSAAEPNRLLVVVGPSMHPPGSHEVAAGGRLLQHCLENMSNLPGVKAEIVFEWPQDESLLDSISSIVFIGDIFPPNRMPETEAILAKLDQMMKRGCGIACIHYAVGLRGEDVAEDGDHPLLRWIGGYFANRTCPHHESFAKVFPQAEITPSAPQHPISRGWQSFTLHDEPYYNNYFGPNGNRPAGNVTVLATSMLPPDSPQREPVAWCIQRPDGGRGFGIVMPHFYKNWALEDLRRFILNGIVWTAKLEVPDSGVQTIAPDLDAFQPESVEFVPRRSQ